MVSVSLSPRRVSLSLSDPLDYGNVPGAGPLRQGGVSVTAPSSKDKDLPSTPSPAAARQAPALAIVRDLWQGTERVRERTTAYLPQEVGESAQNYRIRLNRSAFFNVFRSTVQGLVGFVFRKDLKLGDDVPPVIVDLCENIDLAGTHLDVFARELLTDAMVAGHCAVLVEFPVTGGTQTLADEKGVTGTPIRPYCVPIKKENILSWRTAVENGSTVLTQLVVRECTWVPDGMFGEREQTRYRVFYRNAGVVGFQLLEITENKTVVLVDSGTYPTQPEIPVVEIASAGTKSLFESDPPLLDLAYLNIAHYQQWSDAATSRHKTCVPILVTIGLDAGGQDPSGALVIGPNTTINVPAQPGADVKYVSHDGAALAACKAGIDDLVRDMAALGIAALASEKRAAETAQAKQIDKGATDSTLAVTARGLQDGLESVLQLFANYLRLPDGGSVQVNRDFEAMTMDAAVMSAWASLATALNIPPRVVLEELQAGGRLSEDADVDAIEMDMEARAEAQRQQDAQNAQDQARLKLAVLGAKSQPFAGSVA